MTVFTSASRAPIDALAEARVDECGLATLVGRTVGAPFVGAATVAVVVAELLRMALGEQRYEVIDGSLRSLAHRQALPSRRSCSSLTISRGSW